ncbi:MAG: hypothetical protein ACKO96_06665, partial [Flammeovirgaceae bacterium]
PQNPKTPLKQVFDFFIYKLMSSFQHNKKMSALSQSSRAGKVIKMQTNRTDAASELTRSTHLESR